MLNTILYAIISTTVLIVFILIFVLILHLIEYLLLKPTKLYYSPIQKIFYIKQNKIKIQLIYDKTYILYNTNNNTKSIISIKQIQTQNLLTLKNEYNSILLNKYNTPINHINCLIKPTFKTYVGTYLSTLYNIFLSPL